MQDRPASGPLSLLRTFARIRDVIAAAQAGPALALWEQAMLVDHHLSVEVQVGGARRAARMATKSWRDPGILHFIRAKSEGGHLSARRHYLRWIQFKGTRDANGDWTPGSDRLLADYAARGYPLRALQSFPGMTIVGFLTVPLIEWLGIGPERVTAHEASPAEQYQWLRLLERHWIGAEQGNQISYTLKIFTDRHDLAAFRDIVLSEQPLVRCCAVLPSRPEQSLGYEYLPEEEVTREAFAAIVAAITEDAAEEAIDLEHLRCESGVCPI